MHVVARAVAIMRFVVMVFRQIFLAIFPLRVADQLVKSKNYLNQNSTEEHPRPHSSGHSSLIGLAAVIRYKIERERAGVLRSSEGGMGAGAPTAG